MHNVNISLQVIPISAGTNSYELVDHAIRVIRKSGIVHQVCPMETVMEGDYDKIMKIIKQAHQAVLDAGAKKVLSVIKVELSASADVSMKAKTAHWQNQKA